MAWESGVEGEGLGKEPFLHRAGSGLPETQEELHAFIPAVISNYQEAIPLAP